MPALGDDRTALEEGRSGMDGPQRTIVSTLDYPRRSEWQARVETVQDGGAVRPGEGEAIEDDRRRVRGGGHEGPFR